MRHPPTLFDTRHRLIGALAAIVLHIALLCCWLLAPPSGPVADGTPADTIQWVHVRPAKPVAPPPVTSAKAVVRKQAATPRTARAPAAPTQAEAVPEAVASEPAVQAPPTKSAYDVMQQARRDIGKIDQEIKKEFPEQRIKKPLDTPQARLEKGFELASELAPPKWYEPAKVKELIDPGGYGRKRYRVITARGTYCMTYESAHSPNGKDPFTRGSQPKLSSCDADEEPAKEQKW
ncbi:MAG: hypothetical protein WKG03_03820 [Telluria sp.]